MLIKDPVAGDVLRGKEIRYVFGRIKKWYKKYGRKMKL